MRVQYHSDAAETSVERLTKLAQGPSIEPGAIRIQHVEPSLPPDSRQVVWLYGSNVVPRDDRKQLLQALLRNARAIRCAIRALTRRAAGSQGTETDDNGNNPT